MSFRNKLQNLLVVKAKLSHKQAKLAIENGEVLKNGTPVFSNEEVLETDEICHLQYLIQKAKQYVYYKYNKPVGMECSMRLDSAEALGLNLAKPLKGLQVCGRLDKASEGLLVLTNDGRFIKKITSPGKLYWKTYEVWLEQDVTEEFICQFETGIALQGKLTMPAKLSPIGNNRIEIKLQEGRNKQIRRMCFALGNYVTKLRRIGIGEIELGNLGIGEYELLNEMEIAFVRKFLSI